MNINLKPRDVLQLLLHLRATMHDATSDVLEIYESLHDAILDSLAELDALKFNAWKQAQAKKIDELNRRKEENNAGND